MSETTTENKPAEDKPEADVFSEAFEHLTEMADANKPDDAVPAAETKAEAAPEPAKPDAPVEEPAPVTAEPAQQEEVANEEAATETNPPTYEENTAPSISDEDLIKRFATLVRKAEPVEDQSSSAPPPPQYQEPELFSQEEKQILTDYEKDWPDVAKAEALRRKAEYREIVGYVFSEVAKELRPVLDTVRTMATQTHLEDLQSTIQDYGDVRDKVIDWVAQQPAYLQPAYQHVIQQGTVDEVADLVERYRSDTGAAAPTQSFRAAPRKGSELPQATKQAAASLAPVSSKRSAVIQGVDQGDFDSAFAAFADKL